MSSGIYLIQDNGQLIEMIERPYDSEALLQKLLTEYPNLLAGDQIDSNVPRQWLLIAPEMALPSEENVPGRWAVDHLFLDQEAIPTIVEVKRSSDTRIRREVVGQMLDYAANGVVYWPVEVIRSQFESACKDKGCDPEQVFIERLGGDIDQEYFWQTVKTNLQVGKVRLIFVADKIPTELQRLVEFLNVQMNPAEVLAVEIKQYMGQGLTTLIPRVIGQTAQAKPSGSLQRRQWDELSFLQELEGSRGREEVEVAGKIFEWARTQKLQTRFGSGKVGSFLPTLEHQGTTFTLFGLRADGIVEIYFGYLQAKPPFDNETKRLEWLRHLNEIPGVDIPIDRITKFPRLPLHKLKPERALKQFIDALEWAVQEIKIS